MPPQCRVRARNARRFLFQDRSYKLVQYKRSLIGASLVDWMLANKHADSRYTAATFTASIPRLIRCAALRREEAATYGKQLFQAGLRHVQGAYCSVVACADLISVLQPDRASRLQGPILAVHVRAARRGPGRHATRRHAAAAALRHASDRVGQRGSSSSRRCGGGGVLPGAAGRSCGLLLTWPRLILVLA